MKNILAILLISLVVVSCASVPSYSVRGIVIRLVQESENDRRVVVLHEAIDDFKDRKGNVTGMDVMAMSFALPKDIAVQDIHPGDKVHLNFDVRWRKNPRLWVTDLIRLSDDVQLELDGYELEDHPMP